MNLYRAWTIKYIDFEHAHEDLGVTDLTSNKRIELIYIYIYLFLYKIISSLIIFFEVVLSEMGVRGDRATGSAAGTDLYEGNTSQFQVGI